MTLVIQALRQRMKAREHYKGDSDGLTNPETLVGLIKVINPDYQDIGKDKFKGTANNYKACKTSKSTYLPFNDEQVISAFDETVRTSYQIALNRMIAFVNDFIDLGEAVHKDVLLVRALVDLIQQDQSIDENEVFYIGKNGEKIKKAALGDLKEVCLPSFLLGVWHYVVVNRRDNSVGRETYDEWCPSMDRSPRKYTAHMGEGILDGLVTYLAETKETVAQEILQDEVEIFDEEPEPKQVQQNVNNPFIFNFTQNGDNNTQIGHIEHYHADGKKE